MSKTVWMFPGQGAQKVGMAKDFYENSILARQLFDEADAALDFDLKDTCFEENEQIHLYSIFSSPIPISRTNVYLSAKLFNTCAASPCTNVSVAAASKPS